MADTTTTPNMQLPVPVASQAPGPDWASTVVTDMYAIDSHNHSSGQGVAINPSGLNINSDLAFGNNNATALRSTRYTAQGSPLAGASDLGCVYVSGADLYYNDENGNQVRITASGSVAGSSGTITGLPSGTASASFAAGTFTFQSATNTGATISGGPVAIGSTTANGKQTTISSAASQASNIALVLPTAAPGNANVLASDASGNMRWDTPTGSGTIVRASGATMDSLNLSACAFSGGMSGVITGNVYTPTITNTTGTTAASGSFFYLRINNVVMVSGTISTSPAGNNSIFTISVPLTPTNNFAASSDACGVCTTSALSAQISSNVIAVTSTKTVGVELLFPSNSSRPGGLYFTYSCV